MKSKFFFNSFVIMLISFIPITAAPKKKLYISKINFMQGVPLSIKTSLVNRLKLNFLEKLGDKYQIVSDSDVNLMNQKVAQMQKQGCSEEVCMKQIAEAIDADEMVYGDVFLDGDKIKFSLTNILRDSKTLSMSTKSIVEISFPESQYDFYVKEATYKLIDPKYKNEQTNSDSSEAIITSDWFGLNKLYWDLSSSDKEMNWYDAVKYCQGKGMRLPTKSELETHRKSLNGTLYHWTSTSDDSNQSKAYRVGFDTGNVSLDAKNNYYINYARCVR